MSKINFGEIFKVHGKDLPSKDVFMSGNEFGITYKVLRDAYRKESNHLLFTLFSNDYAAFVVTQKKPGPTTPKVTPKPVPKKPEVKKDEAE